MIVFHAPQSAHCPKGTGCDFIKRILAVPGESVEVKNNGIYINDALLSEPYIPNSYKTLAGEFSKNRVVRLGANEYFAVGDNRPYSSDSRAWGPIIREDIVGRAFYRYWPLQAIGVITKTSY